MHVGVVVSCPSSKAEAESKEKHGVSMGHSAGVGYNLTFCLLKSRLQHIYYGKPRREIRLKEGRDTLAGWRGGWGVNILEDARHSSVLYLCKYFVGKFYARVDLNPMPQ